MKILILCDHYPLSPRVLKIRESILKLYPSSQITVFCWNRGSKTIVEDYVEGYTQKIGYENRIKKAMNVLGFIIASIKHIRKRKPNLIHVIDFTMLLVSFFQSMRLQVVYEVYDIKFVSNRIFNFLREKIEIAIINKKVSSIILASPYFSMYYQEKIKKGIPTVILNNKPNKNIHKFNTSYMDKYQAYLQNKYVIAFIGNVRHLELLTNLIEASKEFEEIVVLIAGDGPAKERISRYILKNQLTSKVILTGRFSLEDLATIYNNCNFVWAAYPNKNLNVKYAISNKFFESVVFNKYIIVSNNTYLGTKVVENKLGYVVDPYDINSINKVINTLLIQGNKKPITRIEKPYWEDEEYRLIQIYRKDLYDHQN